MHSTDTGHAKVNATKGSAHASTRASSSRFVVGPGTRQTRRPNFTKGATRSSLTIGCSDWTDANLPRSAFDEEMWVAGFM
jgi:hypothetical protein